MSLDKDNLAAASRLIEPAESFVIAAHARPDADAIGSGLAIARGLRQFGKRAIVLSEDSVPETCSYLPDAETVLASTSERGFDVAIVCDADGVNRVGSALDAVQSARSLIIIDHHASDHPSSDAEGTLYLTDRTAAATAEIVFELLHGLQVTFDIQIARLLMAGLVGDTGGFRFANVTPTTLEIASRLATYGAAPGEAAREIYENRSLVNTRLLGLVLLAARVSDDGKIISSRITQEDFARFQAADDDTESIVNQLRAIKGVKVAVLFREIEPNQIRVSLRSRDGIDVNRVAKVFGGGGHIAASGCTIEASLEEAEKTLLAEVRAWMES